MTVYCDIVRQEARPSRELRHGRKIEHDSRSLSWEYRVSETLPGSWWQALTGRLPKPKSVLWEPSIPALDQGQTGSCAGNALTQLLATPAANWSPTFNQVGLLTEFFARDIYSAATKIDSFAGVWPPHDTGTSGLAVMKVARKRGFIKGYKHALSINGVITALQAGPCITGIAWRQDMYEPQAGLVTYTGPVVAGHEFEVIGYDVKEELFTFRNSWGPNWGWNGDFFMHRNDYATALADHGDVTVPVYA